MISRREKCAHSPQLKTEREKYEAGGWASGFSKNRESGRDEICFKIVFIKQRGGAKKENHPNYVTTRYSGINS